MLEPRSHHGSCSGTFGGRCQIIKLVREIWITNMWEIAPIGLRAKPSTNQTMVMLSAFEPWFTKRMMESPIQPTSTRETRESGPGTVLDGPV
jgi:hypothetical protein